MLLSHQNTLKTYIRDQASAKPISEELAQELKQLQAMIINQSSYSIEDVHSRTTSTIEQRNRFEDSTLAKYPYTVAVSNISSIPNVEPIAFGARTVQLVGAMSDEALIQLSQSRYIRRFNTAESDSSILLEERSLLPECNIGRNFSVRSGREVGITSHPFPLKMTNLDG